MRQLLYTSSATAAAIGDEIASILKASRRNNAALGITGLLWTDGNRFLQVLEGDDQGVGETYKRICADPRHRAAVVLHDRAVEGRTFGQWSMALLEDTDEAVGQALADASPEVRATFEGVIAMRRAA